MSLHQAAADDNIVQLRLLIDMGAEIDLRDETARTPLMSAVIAQSYAAATALLERGADVNARDSRGSGVLANCRDEKLFELLMSHGVNIHVTNK